MAERWRHLRTGILAELVLVLVAALLAGVARRGPVSLAAASILAAFVAWRLVRLSHDREQARQALWARALRDPLTGLPNRELLADRVNQALLRAQREESMVALMFLDLDGFKHINDAYGHRAGDALLVEVASRIGRMLRARDTLARFAGDEFVVLCADADEAVAVGIAERIGRAMRLPFEVGGGRATVTASIGIAFAWGGVGDADALLRDADAAMYRAKEAGGGYALFDEVLSERRVRQERLRRNLEHATEREELQLVYQPIVALGSDRRAPAHGDVIVGAEALLRWRHPQEGWLPPGEFLPEADASGLIVPVGGWVLHEACRQLALWQSRLAEDLEFILFVNLSPRQASDALLTRGLVRSLEETGADPRGLGVEIAERAVFRDSPDVAATIEVLTSLGIRVALDDFGTGQVPLERARRLPVHVIKIDASFIADIERQTANRALVSAVCGMARELGIAVLAEGVETAAQLQAVRDLGCDLAQGFHLGAPVSAGHIDALLGLARDDTALPGA